MTAREMLEEMNSLEYKVRMINDMVLELEAMLLPGVEYGKIGSMPQGYHADHRVNIIYKLSDAREELIAKRAELYAIRSKLMLAMSQLTNASYVQVLDLRYFQHKRWHAIARTMHYNERWTQRLAEKAIEQLDVIMHEEAV